MADARVHDTGLANEFVRGFTEAREATNGVVYRVHLEFEGACLRIVEFGDLDEALACLREHLRHGVDASGAIAVRPQQSQELEPAKDVSG